MKSIAFGNIATESRETQLPTWNKFVLDMEMSIGIPVEFYYAPTYAGIIEAMRDNRVQVAHFGPAAAVKAVDHANGEIRFRTSYKAGEDGYHAMLLVRDDSPLTSLDDVVARPGQLSLGTGDPDSTSGALMPNHFAWGQHGIDITTHFTRLERHNHEGNMAAVLAGKLDVATGNTVDLNRFTKRHPAQAARLRVIWESPIVLPDPIVWRKDLPLAIKEKVGAFLLDYGRESPAKGAGELAHQQAVLDRIQWWHFKPSDERQLDTVRAVAHSRPAREPAAR